MNTIHPIPFFRNGGLLALLAGALVLPGCGGGGSSGPSSYTVGGTVTGVSGTGLVLQVNGSGDLALDTNGKFSFSTAFNQGDAYTVTLLSPPAGQVCRISNDTGSVSANVSNIGVECRTNVNPTGYYGPAGEATVGNGAGGALEISDFQIIAHDGRFMAMSVAAGLIYDGTMTLFGDEFSGTVSMYHDGVMIQSDIEVSGTITAESSITGTFSGTDEGAGTFIASYSLTNQDDAIITRIVNANNVANPKWSSRIGGSTTETAFDIDGAGEVLGDSGPTDGKLIKCSIYTAAGGDPVAIIPITGSSLYRITIQLSDCTDKAQSTTDGAGYYTGFATSRDEFGTDDLLVFMVTSANGQYAVGGDFR